VGLGSFLIVMGVFLARFWRTSALMAADASAENIEVRELEPVWWGLHAGLIGGLVGGIFDHYFFNLDFHHSVALFWLVIGLATAATEIIQRKLDQATG